MLVYNHDLIGSLIFVYDMDGEILLRTTIADFIKSDMRIGLTKWPPELEVGEECRLLVLTEPSPREFHGRIRQDFGKKYIALFKGKEKESRGATRFKVNYTARIEALVVEVHEYILFEYVDVNIINISTSGMRFRAKKNTLNHGDRFKATVTINDKVKTLYGKVVNMLEVDDDFQDYGCRFITPKTTPRISPEALAGGSHSTILTTVGTS